MVDVNVVVVVDGGGVVLAIGGIVLVVGITAVVLVGRVVVVVVVVVAVIASRRQSMTIEEHFIFCHTMKHETHRNVQHRLWCDYNRDYNKDRGLLGIRGHV